MKSAGLLTSLRRAARWHRRTFAALLAGVAVYAGLTALTHPEGDLSWAVIAVRPVGGGQLITSSDIDLVQIPSAALPEGVITDPNAVVGRTAVAPIPRRAAVTASDLLSGGSLVGVGRVALPVTLDSAAAGLLRVGDTIDIIGAGSDTGIKGIVAAGVRVVAIPNAADSGGFGGSSERLVLIDVTPGVAAGVSSAAAISALSFALH